MLPPEYCHGNEESLRVRPERIWFIATASRLRIGPRGGIYWKTVINLDNPDTYRRYVPGSNRTQYAEDRPFPKARWCGKCGFLFEGGWEVRWDYETEKAIFGYGSTERTNIDDEDKYLSQF